MKFSIHLRLLLGLCIGGFIYVSAARASLDDILAPLPEAELAVSTSQAHSAAARSAAKSAPETVEEDVYFQAILADDVRSELINKMESALRPSGNLTMIPLRDMPDLSSYSHPFSVTLMNTPASLSRGTTMVRFQVENEKGVLGEWNVPFRLHLYSEVWYSRSRLNRGEIASPSDFEIREVDLLAEPDAVPAALELLLRHEYGRDIAPGKPLVWKDLVERSLVRKGDLVEVTAVNGLLAITMRAVARQDGTNGDIILLRNLDSAKEFAARVVGENRAEVIF